MFGMTEREMELYQELVQEFAVINLVPHIAGKAGFGVFEEDEDLLKDHLTSLVGDVETIITITAIHMAYEYAYLQESSEKSEEDIIKHLHRKYEDHLVTQFIKYGVTFTTDILSKIIGEIILELPYIYSSVIEDNDFDDFKFLEDKMEAYEKYIDDYLKKDKDEKEEE